MEKKNIKENRLHHKHYAWIVAIGSCVIFFYSLGLTVNTFSIFLTPLINKIGISKAAGSSIVTVQYAVGVIGMVFANKFYRHFSVRKGALICGLLMAGGYFMLAFSNSLQMCYLSVVLSGLGFAGGSMIPATTLITRWFNEKRGFALSIAACGSGFATIICSPILQKIILAYDVFLALIFQGIAIAVMALVAFIIVRDWPEDKGLMSYGKENVDKKDVQEDIRIDLKDVIRNSKFILTSIAVLLTGMMVIPSINHIAVFYTGCGYSEMFAASMLSLYGTVMLIGKPFYGIFSDKFGTYRGTIYIILVWMLIAISGAALAYNVFFGYMFAFFMGLGAALSPMATPIWTTDLFGKNNYVQIYTYMRLFFQIGGTISLTLPGIVADIAGDYNKVFYLYFLIAVTSGILLNWLYKRYVK
ncbi:MAG: nitrate/nitrite transporter [Anaerovoracaceae bacterium]